MVLTSSTGQRASSPSAQGQLRQLLSPHTHTRTHARTHARTRTHTHTQSPFLAQAHCIKPEIGAPRKRTAPAIARSDLFLPGLLSKNSLTVCILQPVVYAYKLFCLYVCKAQGGLILYAYAYALHLLCPCFLSHCLSGFPLILATEPCTGAICRDTVSIHPVKDCTRLYRWTALWQRDNLRSIGLKSFHVAGTTFEADC